MDGWGLGKVKRADAIQAAATPFVSSLYTTYSHTTLTTCGEAVGLPEGQMGNSEVGHLNLGAGRIVYQELQRINVAIREGFFRKNVALLAAIRYAKENKKPLHLIGLVSEGGVHSHINHLKAILDVCKENGLSNVFIHAFTDGRDCDPKSGMGFLKSLQTHVTKTVGALASVSGRYYAMDRDNRWERVKLAYDALVYGIADKSTDAVKAIEQSYADGITDEFIKPTVITHPDGTPVATIKNDDAVLCFNFRTDRCREIIKALTQTDFPAFDMQKLDLHCTTMTEYDQTFSNIHLIFETDNLTHTLGEVIEGAGLNQIRIAETEKYPHVTFFFSGGREEKFRGEERILVASPKVATYDLKPEMSANELTSALLPELQRQWPHFVCLNYANADMVGHTGVWDAVVKAVETVDACVQRVVTTGLENGYTIFIIADHGNADFMLNEDGSPNTQHSLNPVPFIIVDAEWRGKIKAGKLGDIAPTILEMMGLPIPLQMTGDVLIDTAV